MRAGCRPALLLSGLFLARFRSHLAKRVVRPSVSLADVDVDHLGRAVSALFLYVVHSDLRVGCRADEAGAQAVPRRSPWRRPRLRSGSHPSPARAPRCAPSRLARRHRRRGGRGSTRSPFETARKSGVPGVMPLLAIQRATASHAVAMSAHGVVGFAEEWRAAPAGIGRDVRRQRSASFSLLSGLVKARSRNFEWPFRPASATARAGCQCRRTAARGQSAGRLS